jgi:2-polyprenyl-3-methyl-5-hydroxy-6-metoxy-1,4-benzoquinol methylase
MSTTDIVKARQREYEKYMRAWTLDTYRMGERRKRDAVSNLRALPIRGSYLDVGCGRGEMLTHAAELGFHPVQGVEVVRQLIDGTRVIYAEGWALPFTQKTWDVVALFDVIEHLIPGDDERICRELVRVARHYIILTASNLASTLPDGTQLHINRRPYEKWDQLFAEWFPSALRIMRCPVAPSQTPMWRVDLGEMAA